MTKKYIMSSIYHPKHGYEKEFLRIWKEGICRPAIQKDAWGVGIYHNIEMNEYYASEHWSDLKHMNAFFQSKEVQEVTKKINQLSSSPITRDILEIISEEAA